MLHDSTVISALRELKIEGANGLKLNAEEAGDPSRTPVVLLHGGGQTHHAWAGTAQKLAQAGYYALAYDARGHGDSDWSPAGDYSPDALIADLRAVVSRLPSPAGTGRRLDGRHDFDGCAW